MNNFKLIFRQLWRNRLFTLLNIVGLSIGISACWVIFRIVNYEFKIVHYRKVYNTCTIFKVVDQLYF